MSRVVLYIATSLDGFIADKNGQITWLEPFHGPWEDYGFGEFIQAVGVTITGARTYRQMLTLGPWPYRDQINYVVTSKELPQPTGGQVEFYKGDLGKLVDQTRQLTDKDIYLTGGANLLQQFHRRKLIDEIRLFVVPQILGSGVSLFGESQLGAEAELLAIQPFSTGIVEIHYAMRYDPQG